MKLLKHAKRFWLIPAVMIALGIIFGIIYGGLNWGIDFTGGSIVTIDLKQTFEDQDIQKAFDDLGITIGPIQNSAAVIGEEPTLAVVRINAKDMHEQTEAIIRTELVESLKAQYPEAELGSFDVIDPTIGGELASQAIIAVFVAWVLIMGYIAIRFEWVFGVTAVIGLIHDVLMMLAFVTIIQLQLNSSMVAAILTIVGYSINNTIVIFDRIRENVKKPAYHKVSRMELVDVSIRETMMRTLNTSITTLITLVALYIMGVDSIREFVLPIIVGVVFGTFSSQFLCGPLWATWHDSQRRRKANINKGGKKNLKKA